VKNLVTVLLAGIFLFAVTAGVDAKDCHKKGDSVKACQKDKDPNACPKAKECKANAKCDKANKECKKAGKNCCAKEKAGKCCKTDPNAPKK